MCAPYIFKKEKRRRGSGCLKFFLIVEENLLYVATVDETENFYFFADISNTPEPTAVGAGFNKYEHQ